jgi:uncharacterized membrane protein HdeD (DUF308 family)
MNTRDHRRGLLSLVANRWWVVLLRGIGAVAFGILAFIWPGLTLLSLVLLYGAYALVDGILSIACGVKGGTAPRPWWVMIIAGLLGVAAGIVTFLYPGITAMVLLVIIAFAAIVRGVLEIAAGIRLRQEIEGEFWLILGGVLSIVFGVFLLLRPGVGALAVVWLIGGYAIVFGIVAMMLAFRLRAWQERLAS